MYELSKVITASDGSEIDRESMGTFPTCIEAEAHLKDIPVDEGVSVEMTRDGVLVQGFALGVFPGHEGLQPYGYVGEAYFDAQGDKLTEGEDRPEDEDLQDSESWGGSDENWEDEWRARVEARYPHLG